MRRDHLEAAAGVFVGLSVFALWLSPCCLKAALILLAFAALLKWLGT